MKRWLAKLLNHRHIRYNAKIAASLSVFVGLLLSGCATVGSSIVPDTTETMTLSAPQITPQKATVSAIAPLDGKVLFSVLAAEMALAVDNIELALGLYVTLLKETQDIGVAKRVVTIADRMGDFGSMANAAELWLVAEPKNVTAHLALAISLYQMGHFESMDGPIHNILSLQPDYPIETLFEPTLPTSGDLAALDALFERLLATLPQHAGLHLSRGQWYFSQSRWDDAKKEALSSIKRQESVAAYLLLGKTENHLQGPSAGAVATRKGLKAFPISRRLTVQYAQLSSQAGETAKALPVLDAYYRQRPDDHPVISLYARMALESGENETARRLYENLLIIPPSTNEALFFLGSIALEEDRPETAVAYFRQVTPSDYFDAALSALTSIIATDSGIEAALLELTSAALQHPDQQNIYREKARLLAISNNLPDAIVAIDQGLDRFPDSTQLLYARALLYDASARQDLAIADLRVIIGIDPNHILALNALGYILTNNNVQLDEASNLIQRAYKLNPNDPAITDSLGWVYYRLGDLAKAKTYLETAFDLSGDHEIAAHLGEVLWQLGDKEAADAIWLKGLEQTPASDIILNTRQRLQDQQ